MLYKMAGQKHYKLAIADFNNFARSDQELLGMTSSQQKYKFKHTSALQPLLSTVLLSLWSSLMTALYLLSELGSLVAWISDSHMPIIRVVVFVVYLKLLKCPNALLKTTKL